MCDYLYLFNIVRLIIVTVTKKPNCDHTHERSYTGRNSSTSTIISNIIVPSTEFFSKYGIKKYVIDYNLKIKIQTETSLPYDDSTWKDNKPAFVIYQFENYSWFEVLSNFKYFNVKISGGTKTRRDDFSPTHLRIALFIICLKASKSFHSVWNSFHNTSISDIKTFLDFTKSLDELQKEHNSSQEEVDSDINNKKEYENNNSNNSPFGINGQNRKFHTTPKNKVSKIDNINIDPNWKYLEYKLEDNILKHDDLEKSILNFDDTVLRWNSCSAILLQFKIRLLNGWVEDISFVLRFNLKYNIRMITLFMGFFYLKD